MDEDTIQTQPKSEMSKISSTLKPKSSSATSEVLQSIQQGGNLRPTAYRGMKLGKYVYFISD